MRTAGSAVMHAAQTRGAAASFSEQPPIMASDPAPCARAVIWRAIEVPAGELPADLPRAIPDGIPVEVDSQDGIEDEAHEKVAPDLEEGDTEMMGF